MEPKKYSGTSLQQLCWPDSIEDTLPWHEPRDDGLWLRDAEVLITPTERDVMRWHPLRCEDRPALPFPFTAYELAAFMQAGGGLDLVNRYDFGAAISECGHGVKLSAAFIEDLREADRTAAHQLEDALARLGDNAVEAKEVMREAISLCHQAARLFERDDAGVRQAADWLLNDARRELVAEPGSVLAVEPSGDLAGDARSEGPLPLPTSDVAHAFAGLKWSESAWMKSLGYPPKWLASCRTVQGARGRFEARWDPLLVGSALVIKGAASAIRVRSKFQTMGALAPWLEAWKDREAEYFSID